MTKQQTKWTRYQRLNANAIAQCGAPIFHLSISNKYSLFAQRLLLLLLKNVGKIKNVKQRFFILKLKG